VTRAPDKATPFPALPIQKCSASSEPSALSLSLTYSGDSAHQRHRCGSTCGYAQSDDLEPRARHNGAPARQAGGVATCMPQPQPHTLNTHTNLPSIARPRHLIRSPSNMARIPSICGTMHPQRIRVQRRPDPPQSHQNCLGQIQGSQGARGHPRLKQMTPLMGLSALKSPLPCRRAPNVARCVARPRRGHTVIERQRQIGRSENPQNW
jgi:hypothetical protein